MPPGRGRCLPADAIIVDEASMVDLPLLALAAAVDRPADQADSLSVTRTSWRASGPARSCAI